MNLLGNPSEEFLNLFDKKIYRVLSEALESSNAYKGHAGIKSEETIKNHYSYWKIFCP